MSHTFAQGSSTAWCVGGREDLCGVVPGRVVTQIFTWRAPDRYPSPDPIPREGQRRVGAGTPSHPIAATAATYAWVAAHPPHALPRRCAGMVKLNTRTHSGAGALWPGSPSADRTESRRT